MLTMLILFQLKHFVCDFPLQNSYMLGKFKEKGWFLPLLSHCVTHAGGTLLILTFFVQTTKEVLFLSLFDLCAHFIMDRIKASPKMLGKYVSLTKRDFQEGTPTKEQLHSNEMFWYSLGFDQLVHHLTHYLIVYLAIGGNNV